ncbi:leucine-rich repeat domain-containing protein [Candidatus Halobeggiatoa sp. HSG11]|nr:leucine-rich repeat domain-containing protein [Candidatus Halobeggiatoa sp. HSG11]
MLKQFYFIFIIALLGGLAPVIKAETDCYAVQCNGDNCQPKMPVEQCQTLLKLYKTTSGDLWVNNTKWDSEDPNNFALITTDNTGNVLELELNDNNLTGYLSDLSSLTSATKLILHSNKITGTIPDLSKLTNLTHVNLRNNKLTGSIPDFSGLAKLEKLSLYHNNLCGQIPNLTGLDNLQELDLSHNQLSGPVPSFNTLKNLRLLGISGNKKLCRIEGADYGKVKYAVASLPICSADEQYPECYGNEYIKLADFVNVIGNGKVNVAEVNDEIAILTATPSAGYVFDSWNEVCTVVDNDCQVAVADIDKVIANFSPSTTYFDEYGNDTTITIDDLTVPIVGEGNVTISGCDDGCIKTDNLTLIATPATDYDFTGWNEVCTVVDNNCQVAVADVQKVVANFVSNKKIYTLQVNTVGSGKVTAIGIDCGIDCQEQYVENTIVVLNAIPNDNSIFTGWSGNCSGMATICQVTMTEFNNVNANFAINNVAQFPLTINAAGGGSGVVVIDDIECNLPCVREYAESTEVILTTRPATNSSFVNWTGPCSGSTTFCQIFMTQPQTLTITFNQLPPVPVADLEFVGLEGFYRAGEIVKLDLVEHITTEPIYPRLALWVGIEDPDGLRYYMTELPLEPFSFHPQPFRANIIDYELIDKESIYPVLYFEVPPGIGGEYSFFAVLTEADTRLDDLLFTQNSNTATAKTTLGNTLNPSVLPTAPDMLTMFIGEDLELMIDSETTFDAVLGSCIVLDAAILQTYATISHTKNSVSCYLRALNPGKTILTTTDRYNRASKTIVVVKKVGSSE